MSLEYQDRASGLGHSGMNMQHFDASLSACSGYCGRYRQSHHCHH